MRIGIYIGNWDPRRGGAWTFEQEILKALGRIQSGHEVFVFYAGVKTNHHLDDVKEHFTSVHILEGDNLVYRIFRKSKRLLHRVKSFIREVNYTPDSPLKSAALAYRIDLMWVVSPEFLECGVPFMYTVWDLAHRNYPFFPEVSTQDWIWETREKHFNWVLPKSTYIITGSQEGKNEILRFYPVLPDKIKVLPLPVPSFALEGATQATDSDILQKNGITGPFLFYPAQFWPHKNHIAVLLALRILNQTHGLNFSLVFTGVDKGNLNYIKSKVEELGLSGKVHFTGFVPSRELFALYQKAFALIFPSFFGPDNLPPLEAFALGCPVIASDVPGAKEQLGDAAVLVNPMKEEEFAAAVKRLYGHPGLRQELIDKGKQRALQWSTEDYVKGVLAIVRDFEAYRRCWEGTREKIKN